MVMIGKMTESFELGPIRPPSEAYSLLIRVTRNCSWNRCKFCHIYKGERFQLRSVKEIKQDIETAMVIQRIGFTTQNDCFVSHLFYVLLLKFPDALLLFHPP